MNQNQSDFNVTLSDNSNLRVLFSFPDKHKHAKNQIKTVCRIYLSNDLLNTEIALCNHKAGDRFNKVIGKKEALTKAIKNLNVVDRTKIWETFFILNPTGK